MFNIYSLRVLLWPVPTLEGNSSLWLLNDPLYLPTGCQLLLSALWDLSHNLFC